LKESDHDKAIGMNTNVNKDNNISHLFFAHPFSLNGQSFSTRVEM